MLKKHILFVFLFSYFFGKSQEILELSSFSEISIITSGPGEALYEKFGHTAIRVKDPMLKLDLIYNYGMFDLTGADFYINFTKGFMKYKLARYPFKYSLIRAKNDKRWTHQQVLNLTIDERNQFFKFLEINASPKNASYLYDPFFNNCATKPRDIINTILDNKVTWNDDYTSNASLRELMNTEIDQNTWGSLGINVALGSKLDKKASPSEYLYLPDYVQKALASAKITRNGKIENLISKSKILLDFEEKISKKDTLNPFLAFCLLLILVTFITYKDYMRKKRSKWLDFALFFTTGLVGILITFLWFFTNHSTAPNNFNFLWAFAPNTIIAFYLLKEKYSSWIVKYCLFLLILLTLIPIIWIAKVQLFNWTLIPLLLLLGIRLFMLQKNLLTFHK